LMRGPLEDVIVAKVIVNNQDMFYCYYGVHTSILTNYVHVTSSVDWLVMTFIPSVLFGKHEDKLFALQACEQLFDSWKNRGLELGTYHLHKFFDDYFSICYWTSGYDYAKRIGGEYVAILLENNEFYNEYTRFAERININLKFVDIDVAKLVSEKLDKLNDSV